MPGLVAVVVPNYETIGHWATANGLAAIAHVCTTLLPCVRPSLLRLSISGQGCLERAPEREGLPTRGPQCPGTRRRAPSVRAPYGLHAVVDAVKCAAI